MPEEAISDLQQIAVCQLRAQDPGDLVKGTGQGALRLNVTHACQLVVQVAELGPFSLPRHPNEGWEVERGVVAHILIVGLHGRVDEEIGDALVNS